MPVAEPWRFTAARKESDGFLHNNTICFFDVLIKVFYPPFLSVRHVMEVFSHGPS